MPRKQKKYHYIYKTVCQVTGKFYVGMHSTDDLEDGYLGSGKILGYSRAKHGDENHKKEILEFCETRDELKRREAEIVNEELLADPLNINLKYGGEGGWDAVNDGSVAHRTRCSKAAAKSHSNPRKYWNLSDEQRSKAIASKRTNGTIGNGFLNRKHSEATKAKMRKSKNEGSLNSQFGTRWVANEDESIKVKSEDVPKYLALGYSLGRKLAGSK